MLQRVGGAIGTAVLAVVLQRASAGPHARAELAGAFGTAYWWALGLRRLADPVLVLLRAEGPGGSADAAAGEVAEAAEPIGAWWRDEASGLTRAARAGRRRGAAAERRLTELGRAFRRAFRSLRSMRGRDTHRGDEVGHAQFELLVELYARGEMHAGELAERGEGERRRRSRGMLDHLSEAELIERTRSESDRRIVVVKLNRRRAA